MSDTELIKQAKTVKEALSLVKEAAWVDIINKAKRLKDGGQVLLTTNEVHVVEGQVQGDNGLYDVIIYREDPNNNKITNWECSCDWGKYAWQRTRQWKKFEGRPCSHTMAAMWQSWGQPLTSDPQQTLFKRQMPPAPMTNYEVMEQPVPPINVPEEPTQLTLPGMEQYNVPQTGIRTTKWRKIKNV